MIKLTFFVLCKSWASGGYENTHYFQTEKQARAWSKENGVEIRHIEKVPFNKFAEDYIGG